MRRGILAILAVAFSVTFVTGCGDQASSPLTVPGSEQDAPAGKLLEFDARIEPGVVPFDVNPMDFGDGLVATTTRSGDVIRTELVNAEGEIVARSGYSRTHRSGRFKVPGVPAMVIDDFDAPTANHYGANMSLYYYYRNVQDALAEQAGMGLGLEKMAPGCDYFPDWLETQCILDCCETHDQCWAEHGCSMGSWIGLDGLDCFLCNVEVMACMYNCIPPWVRIIWEIAAEVLIFKL